MRKLWSYGLELAQDQNPVQLIEPVHWSPPQRNTIHSPKYEFKGDFYPKTPLLYNLDQETPVFFSLLHR